MFTFSLQSFIFLWNEIFWHNSCPPYVKGASHFSGSACFTLHVIIFSSAIVSKLDRPSPPGCHQTTMIHRSFSQIHTQFNNHSKTPKKARQKERARRKNTHSHTSHTDYCCYQMHELLKTFCTFLYVAYSKQKEAVRSCTVHTVS